MSGRGCPENNNGGFSVPILNGTSTNYNSPLFKISASKQLNGNKLKYLDGVEILAPGLVTVRLSPWPLRSLRR